MTAPVTDPAVIERIEADFTLAVYRAARKARLRMLGLMPPPPESAKLRRVGYALRG